MVQRVIVPGGVKIEGPRATILYRRDPGRPNHPAVPLVPETMPPKAGSAVNAQEIEKKIAVDSALLRSKLIHRAPDESIDLIQYYQNVVTHGVAPLAVNVVAYVVPNGCVAMIDQIAVFYSDPIVAQSIAIGWRLTINNGQVPNIRDTAFSYIYSGFADLSEPFRIHPVWVQSDQTIALQINPNGTFGEALTVTARMSGKLFKPSTPELIGA